MAEEEEVVAAQTSIATDHDEASTPERTEDSMKGYMSRNQRAKESYRAYGGLIEEKPRKMEVFGWCFYELCSYFLLNVLIPIVFPLIISQIVHFPKDEPDQGWVRNSRGLNCSALEMKL